MRARRRGLAGLLGLVCACTPALPPPHHPLVARPMPLAPQAPAAPQRPAPRMPEVFTRTLASGLRIYLVSRHDRPIVHARYVSQTGELAYPDAPGMSGWMDELILKPRVKAIDQFATTGDEPWLERGFGWSSAWVGSRTAPDKLLPALRAIAATVHAPLEESMDIDGLRMRGHDDLRDSSQRTAGVAVEMARRRLFGPEQRLGVPLHGTRASIERLSASRLLEAFEEAFKPEHSALIVVGDVAADTLLAHARSVFGDTPVPSAATPSRKMRATPGPRPEAVDPGPIEVVHVPYLPITVIAAQRAPARGTEDHVPFAVLNWMLGGGPEGRLFHLIRTRRAASYAPQSTYVTLRGGGFMLISADARERDLNAAANGVIETITALAAGKFEDTEANGARSAYLEAFAERLETPDGLADELTELFGLGLEPDVLQREWEQGQRLAPERIATAARKYLGRARAVIEIAGPHHLTAPQAQWLPGPVRYEKYPDPYGLREPAKP